MAIAKRKGVKVTIEKGSNLKKSLPKNADLTDEQRKKIIDGLIDELRSAQFPGKKKQLRRSLRALGHKGGLKALESKK